MSSRACTQPIVTLEFGNKDFVGLRMIHAKLLILTFAGNFSLTTGKNWSLELGRLKIKARPGGGMDIKMDPSPNQTPGRNGGNPYEDPSVKHLRKRRSLESWISQEDLPEEYPRKRRSVKSWISKKAQLSEEDPRLEYTRKRRSLVNWISKKTHLTKEATDSTFKKQ